jgi:hypothetical protein
LKIASNYIRNPATFTEERRSEVALSPGAGQGVSCQYKSLYLALLQTQICTASSQLGFPKIFQAALFHQIARLEDLVLEQAMARDSASPAGAFHSLPIEVCSYSHDYKP